MTIDPTQVSFSQAQGYESLPQQLNLEELNRRARIGFWNAFYQSFMSVGDGEPVRVVFDAHVERFAGAVDEFPEVYGNNDPDFEYFCMGYKQHFLEESFNLVFDTLTFLLRHDGCPSDFQAKINDVFRRSRLAYVIDFTGTPTIYPAVTPEEGQAIIDALGELNEPGLDGARNHLMDSATFINQGEWHQSVRESITAVESVARQIAPGTNSLRAALNQLRRDGLLEHRALEQGLGNLYGYTSDEQGVRHSLLDQGESNVGQDEAVFMLGACASFASYLWRKHLAINQDAQDK